MIREDRKWIKRVWAHYWAASMNPKMVDTSWWECLRVTVAILLGRRLEARGFDWIEVAWGDFYRYGECGIGRGWDTLAVRGWSYTIYDDGDY